MKTSVLTIGFIILTLKAKRLFKPRNEVFRDELPNLDPVADLDLIRDVELAKSLSWDAAVGNITGADAPVANATTLNTAVTNVTTPNVANASLPILNVSSTDSNITGVVANETSENTAATSINDTTGPVNDTAIPANDSTTANKTKILINTITMNDTSSTPDQAKNITSTNSTKSPTINATTTTKSTNTPTINTTTTNAAIIPQNSTNSTAPDINTTTNTTTTNQAAPITTPPQNTTLTTNPNQTVPVSNATLTQNLESNTTTPPLEASSTKNETLVQVPATSTPPNSTSITATQNTSTIPSPVVETGPKNIPSPPPAPTNSTSTTVSTQVAIPTTSSNSSTTKANKNTVPPSKVLNIELADLFDSSPGSVKPSIDQQLKNFESKHKFNENEDTYNQNKNEVKDIAPSKLKKIRALDSSSALTQISEKKLTQDIVNEIKKEYHDGDLDLETKYVKTPFRELIDGEANPESKSDLKFENIEEILEPKNLDQGDDYIQVEYPKNPEIKTESPDNTIKKELAIKLNKQNSEDTNQLLSDILQNEKKIDVDIKQNEASVDQQAKNDKVEHDEKKNSDKLLLLGKKKNQILRKGVAKRHKKFLEEFPTKARKLI